MSAVGLRGDDPLAVGMLWVCCLPALDELDDIQASVDGRSHVGTCESVTESVTEGLCQTSQWYHQKSQVLARIAAYQCRRRIPHSVAGPRKPHGRCGSTRTDWVTAGRSARARTL